MRHVSEIGKIMHRAALTPQMLQVTNTSCHDNELVLRLFIIQFVT